MTGWPDWSGRSVLIAASGPSQRQEDLELARGRCAVVAINDTWRLAPWADVLYACDAAWWKAKGPAEFAGLKVIGKGAWPGALRMPVRTAAAMQWDGEAIGGGGNSGFQALNLVALWGASRVLLTGFDYRDPALHWFGEHPPELFRPAEAAAGIWVRCMTAAAPVLKARGVTVINCSRETALRCFPRQPIAAALGSEG